MRPSRYRCLKCLFWPFPFFLGACLQVCPARIRRIVHSNCAEPSRCFHGMLNGNMGVMKSMMAELTDESNVARGSSLISVTWAIGGVIGFGTSLLSFVLWLISGSPGPSLVVCYRGRKIVGQMSSRIHSGENTHTSCRVSPPLHMHSYHFLWLRFS